MKILSTDQIRQADAYTIKHEPIASIDLMERAASQLFGWIRDHYDHRPIFRIFTGHGNNGGDGLALARMLLASGFTVHLHFAADPSRLSPDSSHNFTRLPDSIRQSIDTLNLTDPLPRIDPGDIVIDALLGTGLTREPDGIYARLINHINASGNEVIAVDLPSGLFGEDNRLNSMSSVIKARRTLSFQFPKLAFFFPGNHPYVGDWTVLPIGLHPDFIEKVQTPWNFISQDDAAERKINRLKFSHKGDYGHILLVAGSWGKMGAAVLAARGALRSGAGLVTVHTPSKGVMAIHTAVPEAMVSIDDGKCEIQSVPDLSAYNSCAMGPGLGTSAVTHKTLLALLERIKFPVVLDADALNILAKEPGSLLKIPKNSILTPHPGEFKRLFGEDPDDFTRMTRITQLAVHYGLIFVLKGGHTMVITPEGKVWFNTNGNPGMATGGSGDVLTGILGSLLAQGISPTDAAILGVYLHGRAGDLAAHAYGEAGMIAGDIAEFLGKAMNNI